ncbi:MAG: hypothetical protein P4L22_04165 [Candidatus Babeliales bacterium]|nr:hypothetical protein [Candidatus Babeliales bacterium]
MKLKIFFLTILMLNNAVVLQGAPIKLKPKAAKVVKAPVKKAPVKKAPVKKAPVKVPAKKAPAISPALAKINAQIAAEKAKIAAQKAHPATTATVINVTALATCLKADPSKPTTAACQAVFDSCVNADPKAQTNAQYKQCISLEQLICGITNPDMTQSQAQTCGNVAKLTDKSGGASAFTAFISTPLGGLTAALIGFGVLLPLLHAGIPAIGKYLKSLAPKVSEYEASQNKLNAAQAKMDAAQAKFKANPNDPQALSERTQAAKELNSAKLEFQQKGQEMLKSKADAHAQIAKDARAAANAEPGNKALQEAATNAEAASNAAKADVVQNAKANQAATAEAASVDLSGVETELGTPVSARPAPVVDLNNLSELDLETPSTNTPLEPQGVTTQRASVGSEISAADQEAANSAQTENQGKLKQISQNNAANSSGEEGLTEEEEEMMAEERP